MKRFPPANMQKTPGINIKEQKNGRKMAEKWWPQMKTPIQAVGRELLSSEGISQTDLCLATGLPSWKISRLLKRFELLGFVKIEREPRFTRGRPRKLCRLTPSGIEYFTGLLKGASDDNRAKGLAPSVVRAEAGR